MTDKTRQMLKDHFNILCNDAVSALKDEGHSSIGIMFYYSGLMAGYLERLSEESLISVDERSDITIGAAKVLKALLELEGGDKKNG